MRYPAATWKGPVPNHGGPIGPIHGLVLHIQEGSEAGTDAWFHNPASKVSAHFGNPRTGPLDQWVDTDIVAWAEVDEGSRAYSCESVRDYARLLAQLGYQVRRSTEAAGKEAARLRPR